MTRPTVTVEIAFQSNPLTTPTWTDVSAYVLGFGYQRGRQRDLNRAETGTAYIYLNNEDNRFDPTYSGSPYWFSGVGMQPSKRVRIYATWLGNDEPLFDGFVRRWNPEWDGDGRGSRVRLELNDGFYYFAQRKTTGAATSLAQARSDVQIAELLDDILWPAADRDLDTGDTTVQAQTFGDGQSNVLPILQNIADTENGILFMNGAGQIVFHRRSYRATKTTNDATFGPTAAGYLPYRSCQIVYDDVEIRNDVRLARAGGTQQTAYDATSESNFFRRDSQKSGLLHLTDAEALAQANYVLSRYKDPAVRITSMETNGDADDALWPYVLGLDLDDRIRVIRPRPNLPSINEVQSLAKTGFPTGGTFTITFDGQTTGALAHNTSVAAIQAALEALPNIGAGNVTCSGTWATAQFTYLTFVNALGGQNLPEVTVTASFTGGFGSPGVTVNTVTDGVDRTITKDGFIDNLDVRVDEKSWVVRYTLADAALTSAWILEDATYGVLGTTTIPGY